MTVPKVNSQVGNYTHLSIVSLIQNQATFQGGRLSQFLGVWKRLTSDPFILDAISHCHIDFDTEPLQDPTNVNTQCKFTDAQQTIIDTEIAKFLNKRIIKPSEHESGEKALNASVTYYHFKMDTLETAIRLMTPGCFMTSIDLKDVYYSVPMALEHQNILNLCGGINHTPLLVSLWGLLVVREYLQKF